MTDNQKLNAIRGVRRWRETFQHLTHEQKRAVLDRLDNVTTDTLRSAIDAVRRPAAQQTQQPLFAGV